MAKKRLYPAIPRGNDQRQIESLTQIAEILIGASGNKLEKAVTYRELETLGITSLLVAAGVKR
ncbi:hypothetical protein ACFQMB_14360 [Pseudobowmanella zhangzhouensis]|uniref:hypothetical protein n=1 Tax=Pseudobowmanella zhangzhouensis TaxID=1537679 RepID=UPI0036200113